MKRRKHTRPPLVPHEVAGQPGYWRAVHATGLVQIVHGTRAEALHKVQAQVDRLNAFEHYCTHHAGRVAIVLNRRSVEQCRSCGHEWTDRRHRHRATTRCPQCDAPHRYKLKKR